jgi:hypothetical protein
MDGHHEQKTTRDSPQIERGGYDDNYPTRSHPPMPLVSPVSA